MISRGKRVNTPDINQSTSEKQALAKVMVEPTAGGASAEVDGIFDDDPMCMQMTVPVSSHAAKNGSQKLDGSWMDGSPRNGGISEKQTARAPRAALRRTSTPASSASQSGINGTGISRPPESPHHSSTIQSL